MDRDPVGCHVVICPFPGLPGRADSLAIPHFHAGMITSALTIVQLYHYGVHIIHLIDFSRMTPHPGIPLPREPVTRESVTPGIRYPNICEKVFCNV